MNSKRAEGYITPCLIILCVFLLLEAVISFAGAVQMTRLSQQSVKICLDSFVTENAQDIFSSIKDGDNALDALDTESFTDRLIVFLGLEKNGNMLHHRDSNGKEVFRITIPELGCSTSGKLQIYATYTVSIPLYFCGVLIDTAEIPLRVDSKFTNVF